MSDRLQVNLSGYTASKIKEKLEEANSKRAELGRKPIRICDFMAEAADRVTVAQLVRA